MNRPPVGVVIVNHNLKDSLQATLESVKKINYPSLSIVVSDNASSDGAPDMVRSLFPDVQVLAHKEEQGYARAASLGMACLVDKVKYIFSTTNDVIFDPEIINVLVDYAEKNSDAGVLGTKIYLYDKPNVIWHAGGRTNPVHGRGSHIGWFRRDAARYSRIRECDFCTGCGYLLRTEVLKKVGFFREDFIFYSEDSELCYRFKEAGYKVVYIPGAKMWHKICTTLSKNRPAQLYYSTRNQLYLIERHKVGYYPLSLWVNMLVVSPVKMLIFALMFRWQNSRGIYRGIRDFRRRKFGWVK